MTTIMAEVLWWCKQKKRKRNKKSKVIGPLTSPGKGTQTRSYHGIATNDGDGMSRGTAALPELAIERRKTIII